MKKALRIVAWIIAASAAGLVVLVMVVAGFNAMDEDLSPEAHQLMALTPVPAPDEKNGYIDMLGMDAAAGQDTYKAGLVKLALLRQQDASDKPFDSPIDKSVDVAFPSSDKARPRCRPEELPCLQDAAKRTDLAEALSRYAAPMERYRAMRAKPVFVDLFIPRTFESPLPSYRFMSEAQGLTLMAAAARANAGDLDAAVAELEAENAFHRRMAAGAATLVGKVTAMTLLSRDALFAAELAKAGDPGVVKLQPRLREILRPLSKAESGMEPVLQNEFGALTRLLSTNDERRIFSAWGANVPDWYLVFLNMPKIVPVYRPHETVNWATRQFAELRKLATTPAAGFWQEADASAIRKRALISSLDLPFVNPVGKYILNVDGGVEAVYRDYIARTHDTQGLFALASVRLKLATAGASTPEAIEAALAGEIGAAHLDPYTGKSMKFDVKTQSVGFETRTRSSALTSALKKRFGGRIAVPMTLNTTVPSPTQPSPAPA